MSGLGKWIGVALLMFGLPAQADTTVCYGDDCTVVSGNGTRKLTPQEVRRKQRDETRQHLYEVNCTVAISPEKCRQIISTLLAQFPE